MTQLLPCDFLKVNGNGDWLMVVRAWSLVDDINAAMSLYLCVSESGRRYYVHGDKVAEIKAVSDETRKKKLVTLGSGKHWDDCEKLNGGLGFKRV